MSEEELKDTEQKIRTTFGDKNALKLDEFDKVVTDVCGFPNFFRDSLFEKIDK